MAIIQVDQRTSGGWQKTYRIKYSAVIGGYTDVFEYPQGAQGYNFQYFITNTGAGTLQMQKSCGTTADILNGTALWSNVGSAVAANTVGDQTGQFTPIAVRFQVAGTPNANDTITVECSFK